MIPKRLAAARIKLASKMPYLSSAIWAMQPCETKKDLYLAVDQYWRIYYNTEKLEEWSVNELSAGLAHEVMHLIRDHAGRCKHQNLSHELFNVSADCEINDDLRKEHLALPEGTIFPEDFDLPEDKLAEWYYEQLGDQAQELPSPSFGGSAGDGEPRDYELPPPNQTKGDQAPGVNKAEGDLIRNKTAKDVRDHAKNRGNVPGNLERWADSQLKPTVNWKKLLAAAIRQAVSYSGGMTDYSYRRPSRRRSAHGNVILPGMVHPNVRVSVVIDTSGSMDDEALSKAVAEVGGILKTHVGNEGVSVFSVDAAVSDAKKVFSKSQISLSGGAGTDMRVGIQAVEEQKPKPDFCIVVTDGYTPWPETPTNTKLIIALTEPGMKDECPSYAKTIVIE